MTEAILNNVLQVNKNDFSPAQAKKPSANTNSGKSFSETMQEINQHSQKRQQKTVEKKSNLQQKESPLSENEFMAELREILSKNKKEIPAELLSLLQGGSLNNQQKAMLEKLMLNLKNSNLDISDLKNMLAKNSDSTKRDTAEQVQLFSQNENTDDLAFESLDAEQLDKLAALLETNDQALTETETSNLKSEIDQLAELLINSSSKTAEAKEQNLKQILGTENLQSKLGDLASILKTAELSTEDLNEISEQKGIELPLLKQALASEKLNFSDLSANLSSDNNSSLFTEFAAQLKEMLQEESNKMTSQQGTENIEFNNSDIFSLNSDSALDLSFGSELENKNQNNFFDLDNSNLFFNLDLENQSTANNLNLENFSLNSDNTANLAENADLRSQVVEQFRGEYSPETKEMQIQLKPESLGKIDISLSYDNEQLTGKMLVESELVRAQLENSLKGLKSDLLKQGINIEQFKIETAKNAPQQVEKQNEFAFDDQNSAFSDGETGQNQEYEQRQFFQGQYYVKRNNGSSSLDSENIVMRQQEMINRAAFSNEKLNLLA
jgi:flagellar hook-length control protein FliK